MDETNLSQDLISIQEDSGIPYEKLIKFAGNLDYLNGKNQVLKANES